VQYNGLAAVLLLVYVKFDILSYVRE
jgi:hypothetical protein